MPTRLYSSISVETTLASNINSSVTSMQVATGTASTLLGGVTIVANSQFTVALDPDTINEEIVFITAGPSGDTFTITRGRAGSSAVAHSTGATIKHVLTSDDLTAFAAGISPVTSLGFSGSTSGTTTVQATAIAGTNTLTLPATTSDTLVGLAATQTLTNKTLTSPVLTTPSISNINAKGDILVGTADNTLGVLSVGTNTYTLVADSAEATGLKWAAPGGGGKVLQVVQGTLTTSANTNSGVLTNTGLTINITPSLSTSKVLVMAFHNDNYIYESASSNDCAGEFALVRNSTQLQNIQIGGFTLGGITNRAFYAGASFSYLDSPASTSAITYKTQFRKTSGSASIAVQSTATGISSIIAMEIGV